MKFTLPWLKEHLETEATLDVIVETLTSLGLEVDTVQSRGADLSPFKVAEVVGVRRHPQAERLSLCEVDAGDGIQEVVCGAPNVRLGMKAVFAAAGTVIPESGEALKRATIRGVESNGMLCSARELNLGQDHSGIIELDPDAAVGRPASEVIHVEGPVIDVDLTPDRGDCFGVVGIARELAAADLGTLRARNFDEVGARFESGFRVDLEFPEGEEQACPLFVSRVFRGVTNGPSPAWVQERLTAIGLRPISALVDITNLITIDLGRPLHVFDGAKLRGNLVVRFAQGGEELLALDGRTYTLEHGMTVIADDSGPVSLGGVMGGESTGCTAATTDVVLEVALFDPVRTARTGRRLGIESDARTRFERGLDPAMVMPGMEYASRLLLEFCGGEASQPIVSGALPPPREALPFRINQIERLAGVALAPETVLRHLKALGFGLGDARDGEIDVTPPSWRHDVTQEADVVEELVRLHGYDKIPPMVMRRTEAVAQAILTPEQRNRAQARRTLATRGLAEAVTWSFLEPALAERFGDASIRLQNPLNAELSVLRPSLLPNLLAAACRNEARGLANVALFEVGPAFRGLEPERQETVAGGLRFGRAVDRHWAEATREVDVFDVRADAIAALAATRLNTDALKVVAGGPEHYHPGRKGRLMLGPQTVLAEFGEIHPAILREVDTTSRAVGFEVFLDRLPRPKTKGTRGRAPLKASPYPPVDRDFAFVVADEVAAETLLSAVRASDKTLIQDVSLFDVYSGKGLEPGKKSLALAVRLQAMDHTLTEPEIDTVAKKIVAAANKAAGAELRQ